MARNGSGTYVLPAGNPVVTGTTISSTWANNTLTDIASGLTTSIAYDGQTTPVANLPMGGFAHTNIANATVRTMYPSAGQVQDNALTYLTGISGSTAITATAPIVMTAYATGQKFTFVAAGTNTGAATLNINSIGVKSITKNGTTALVAGDLISGAAVEVVYDGTQFQLINPNITILGVSSALAPTSITPNSALYSEYNSYGLTAGLTINAPSGTPVDGAKLTFRFLDNGTSRTLTWTSTWPVVIGTTLPVSTTPNKVTYVGMIYSQSSSRWEVVAVTTQL